MKTKTICNLTASVLVGAAIIINLNTGSFILSVILGLIGYYFAEHAKRSLGLNHWRSGRTEDSEVQNYFPSGTLTEDCRRNGAGA